MCRYHIADKLPKGEFKRLICRVIHFDKEKTIIFNQCLASKPFKSRCVGRNLLELVSLDLLENLYEIISDRLEQRHYFFSYDYNSIDQCD